MVFFSSVSKENWLSNTYIQLIQNSFGISQIKGIYSSVPKGNWLSNSYIQLIQNLFGISQIKSIYSSVQQIVNPIIDVQHCR